MQWRKLEEADDFKYVFVVYCALGSAPVHELLSNNSLFGQLKEVKSLALRARNLVFFTTDLQTVNN